MPKRLLTISLLLLLYCTAQAQTFYGSVVDGVTYHSKTFQLNVSNCDSQAVYTCPPTDPYYTFDYFYADIALDTSGNVYYVSIYGDLYESKLNDSASCRHLGTISNYNVNALAADDNGDLYITGNQNGDCILYKYTAATGVISTVTIFPIGFQSIGDLFFYEGYLFLTVKDNATGTPYLAAINKSNNFACYYMSLNNLDPESAFSIKTATGSRAFIISVQYIPTNKYQSTLYEIDMKAKTISAPICTYPYHITGAGSVYKNGTGKTLTSCSDITLPLQLLSFTHKMVNNSVQLNWQTASEINSNYFIVEKSMDGKNFRPIGKVEAAQNSSTIKKYSVTDVNPAAVNYYRLQEVDKDGHISYSNVIEVSAVARNGSFIVSQNATSIYIQLNKTSDKITLLNIYDPLGRKVKSIAVSNNFYLLDKSNLTQGTYFLQMMTASGQLYNYSFIKAGK